MADVMCGPDRDFTYTATAPSNSSITYSDTTNCHFEVSPIKSVKSIEEDKNAYMSSVAYKALDGALKACQSLKIAVHQKHGRKDKDACRECVMKMAKIR